MISISSLDSRKSRKILKQAEERKFDVLRVKELVDFWFKEYIDSPESIDELIMGVLE